MLHSYKFYRLVSKEGVKFDHIRILRMESLSFAEAPYGRFLNIWRARGERKEEGKGGIPRALPVSLSPGLRPRSLYGQSSTTEASAEARGTEYWTGTILQWRLIRRNKLKLLFAFHWKDFPHEPQLQISSSRLPRSWIRSTMKQFSHLKKKIFMTTEKCTLFISHQV